MGCSNARVIEMKKENNISKEPLIYCSSPTEDIVKPSKEEQEIEKQEKNQEEDDQTKKAEIRDTTAKETLVKEIRTENTVLIAYENNTELNFAMPHNEQINNTSLNGIAMNESKYSEKQSFTQSVVDGISLKCGSVCLENQNIQDKNDCTPENEANSTLINSSLLNIKVKASRYEAMYPVWVEDSKKITFQVSGEWIVDDSLPSATSNGIPTDIENSFYPGALVCRVLGGDYFAVTDGLVYESRTSGPLFLKMHLTNLRVCPKGTLDIKISGACEMKFAEIEEKIGWNKSQIIPRLNDIEIENKYNIPELELSTLIFLNKMRINPILFAQQYLENIRYLTKSTLNLYNYLTTLTQTFPPFRVNSQLINLALECYSSYLDVKTANKEHLSLYLHDELERKVNSTSQCKGVKLNIKRHEDSKPLSLAIKFTLDEKIRNNIFNKDSIHIGFIVKQADKIQSRYNTSVLLFAPEIDQTENNNSRL